MVNGILEKAGKYILNLAINGGITRMLTFYCNDNINNVIINNNVIVLSYGTVATKISALP